MLFILVSSRIDKVKFSCVLCIDYFTVYILNYVNGIQNEVALSVNSQTACV